ncbi:MAG: homogentisate 1,2-dioxygenase [Nitrospinaceae bacterium]|nr:homogentisate 1,2-dioxygenase [Nitrospinaceae bacterium]NIR53482.1 homogentisate 1,2-dioxygenase [Nitrospinaceae bacterium]NIS83880.1 homogentisate 1,2-dioxygenase [Nitrospinaceae bacterium]NIT80679.1 homogentisate 1,2-dioxygenase [Nitrospinaceae bacterium]NIU42999.1 homogentisate 1,2-dioxygenase [Nitrospinaceae bacterium]
MFKYLKFGNISPMHHTAHYVNGHLMSEYCFTRQGFEDFYSILYFYHPPTSESERIIYKEAQWGMPRKRETTMLERRHFHSRRIQAGGNFISGRTLLAFNDDLTYGIGHPEHCVDTFFANNEADELFFLAEGRIHFQSLFGTLDLEAGDYLLIPRSCPYRFRFEKAPRLVYVEAKKDLSIPKEYINDRGQLKMDAPYSERSFKTPEWDEPLFSSDEPVSIVRKRQGIFTRTDYPQNYFKMSGWDGYVYPFAINIDRIQPKTGRVHLPPVSHMTFTGGGFAIMTFLPRVLDFDEQAVPCPFYHSSVNCDELLFYHSGDFTSRKTIGPGSISFHPSGIPHGPHPGAYKNSIGLKKTNEQAVMVDTFAPLYLTPESQYPEDPDYPKSWQEAAHES